MKKFLNTVMPVIVAWMVGGGLGFMIAKTYLKTEYVSIYPGNQPLNWGQVTAEHVDTINHKRYFFISYTTTSKNGNNTVNGWRSFSSFGFPSLLQTDSVIYDGMEYERSCLQPPIITSIFEFKDSADFFNFTKDHKGNAHFGEKKKLCSDSQLNIQAAGARSEMNLHPIK